MPNVEYLEKFQRDLETIGDKFTVLPKQYTALQEIILLLDDLIDSSGEECSDFIQRD